MAQQKATSAMSAEQLQKDMIQSTAAAAGTACLCAPNAGRQKQSADVIVNLLCCIIKA